MTLSGQVLDVTVAGRIPVPDVPVRVSVLSGNCPAIICSSWFTRATTSTGPDGRYQFSNLPPGSAVVRVDSPNHHQVCGAFTAFSATTMLDVEVVSRTNPPPTLPSSPLRVSGRIFEITPEGRVPSPGAEVLIDWFSESTFLSVTANATGHYSVCGIPADYDLFFYISRVEPGRGTDYRYKQDISWRQRFAADATLDVVLTRVE